MEEVVVAVGSAALFPPAGFEESLKLVVGSTPVCWPAEFDFLVPRIESVIVLDSVLAEG